MLTPDVVPLCAGGKSHHGGHSGWGHFFAFLLLVGVATAAFGVWWNQFASGALLSRAFPLQLCSWMPSVTNGLIYSTMGRV